MLERVLAGRGILLSGGAGLWHVSLPQNRMGGVGVPSSASGSDDIPGRINAGSGGVHKAWGQKGVQVHYARCAPSAPLTQGHIDGDHYRNQRDSHQQGPADLVSNESRPDDNVHSHTPPFRRPHPGPRTIPGEAEPWSEDSMRFG